jgi:hypothetical protein
VLSYTEELRDRVERLLEDVGPLHTVSALGFSDARPERVSACLGAVGSDRRWRFVDLRDRSKDDAQKQLAGALNAEVLVVVTRCDRVPEPLRGVVSAFVDKSKALDLGTGDAVPRRSGQSLVLVCEGCNEIAGAARELVRVPYWEFIA